MAQASGQSIAKLAKETQVDDLITGTSLKAALDMNWDDLNERSIALETILNALDQVKSEFQKKSEYEELKDAQEALSVARQIQSQDVTIDSSGKPTLIKGVAKDRRISIEDSDMRHGRKSRSQRFNGYKRHVLRDLDIGVVRSVGLTSANVPEAQVTEAMDADLKHQKVKMVELHIDRAYLPSHWVQQRSQDLTIFCKAWPVRNGDRFVKTDFVLDWEQGLIHCPNHVSIPFESGKTVHFPTSECSVCPIRERCTTSVRGRNVSIHADEAFMQELREGARTLNPEELNSENVRALVHTLAHLGQWQGDRARYQGLRKNLFDLRRVAVVHNLHVIARLPSNASNQNAFSTP